MVDSAGKAKERQSKIEHHAQLFEPHAGGRPGRDVQTTDGVREERVSRRFARKPKTAYVGGFWCHSDATGVLSQSRDPIEPACSDRDAGLDRRRVR